MKHHVRVNTNYDDWTEVELTSRYGGDSDSKLGLSSVVMIYEGHDDHPEWLGDLLDALDVELSVVVVDFEARDAEMRRDFPEDGETV